MLSVLLSAAMILGPASTAFAAGQVPSDEVTVSAETSALESQDEFETEEAGQDFSQDDSNISSGQESAEAQKTSEEGEAGTETGSEEVGIVEEETGGDSKATAEEDSTDESKTDSDEEEKEKPETLVGAEGERVSVGENVTAGFDSETGTVTFYSQGGTLFQDWLQELGIDGATITAIIISEDSDVIHFPVNSSGLFQSLSNLKTLDLSKVDTSNVTNMSGMFDGCSSLQVLDVSGFDTSNVTNMSFMFCVCSSLRTLDVSCFDTSNVTNMKWMFERCSSLRTLNVSGFDTSNVENMSLMFQNCSSLRTLDVSGFSTSNATDITQMFCECSCLQALDVSGFDTSNVTNMSGMFYHCSSLITLDVNGFDTSNVKSMSGMFFGCSSLLTLDVSGFDTQNVTNMYSMFFRCVGLQALDVSGLDTSNVTSMAEMFYGCSSLQKLDLSGFNTSKTTEMSKMFYECSGLQALDVSGLDTSNVTNMSGMFFGCSSLQTLNLSGFDTSNVRNMSEMFSKCSNLQELEVRNFDISNVDTLDRLFQGCSSLQRLDLNSFDMDWVKSADKMLTIIGSNLLIIMTPINVHESISLPYTFVDVSGTEYNSLPEGLSESIRLTKKGVDIPADLEILSLSDDYYGKNGTQASFHIDAQGGGTVSYQWQYKLANSNEWRTPSQASAMTADYTFKLKPSYDNMQVRCIVSDKYGFEVISETRNVNVFALTSQPADAVVTAGQTVNFDVDAIGKDLTYQWYYKRPNASWRKVTVKGYNTSSLPITGGEKNNGTSYRCVITDNMGNSITSSPAVITVVSTLQIIGLSDDVYGKGGTEATFHIDAVGQGDLTYQWQYKLAGESKWRTPAQASAKTTDYVFKLRTSYDNIEVRCIVKDAVGNTCTSDVRKANVFAITKQPNHVFAVLGENVTFAVEGIGQNLTYQWYSRSLEGSWTKVTEAGNNTASLTITAQVRNNGYQYRCYVYDGLGNRIKSQAAMLIERNEEYED